jgi:hypothetical protein
VSETQSASNGLPTPLATKTPWVTGRLGRFGRGQRLLFGATYEDPAIEIAAFDGCNSVVCIAGAGDLARALAEAGFSVTALDINQKQIDYAKARSNGAPFRRGSAERIMALGRMLLRPAGWSSSRMATLANSTSTNAQVAVWNSLTSGFSGFVLRVLLSPAKLAAAFRPEFVSLVGAGFAPRLVLTLRAALENVPNCENPFASLLFLGEPLKLSTRQQSERNNNPNFLCADILAHLSSVPSGSFDAAAMSNIGDGAPESFRVELDRALRHALKPGAPITVRTMGNVASLSSNTLLGTLASTKTGPLSTTRSASAKELAATDRSLIWSGLEVQHNKLSGLMTEQFVDSPIRIATSPDSETPETSETRETRETLKHDTQAKKPTSSFRQARARMQCHPFPIATTLRDSLVLLYAVDAEVLQQFCPPGLELERVGTFGMVALATVQASNVRPRGAPSWFGRDFMLTGYRVVVRFRAPDGTIRRALRIIQSDTDSAVMRFGGNVFTEYGYRRRAISTGHAGDTYSVHIANKGIVELAITADVATDEVLPVGSPFSSTREARRYTGPLPWTIGYIEDLDSFIAVRGHRTSWKPRLVSVNVDVCTFFDQSPFRGHEAKLAAAFYMESVDYSWDRGVRLTPEEVSVAQPAGKGESEPIEEDD